MMKTAMVDSGSCREVRAEADHLRRELRRLIDELRAA
jgi:hypothetical protein